MYEYLLVGHVGDSRAVLCCKTSLGDAVSLTTDHTLRVDTERERVISKGGLVETDKDIPRVSGHLTTTRSIGKYLACTLPCALAVAWLYS